MPIRNEKEKIEESYIPSKKVILASISPDEYDIDKDLKLLRKVMIKPTYKNLEEAFWRDSISTSFTNITASVIIGDGLRIRCKDKKATEIIKNWNRKINVRRETIEDFIKDSWFDSIIYGRFFWRVDNRSKEYVNVDLQRIDPKTIKIKIDPVMGYRKFRQYIENYNYYRSKKAFYRSKKDQKYGRLYSSQEDRQKIDYGKTKDTTEITIDIPDELNAMLHEQFFKYPPIANALHFIVYKRWILWFMRKYSEKHWAPFVIVKIGDPKTNIYPVDPHKMQKAIVNAKKFISQITNFGGVALPGEISVETLEKQSARSSEIYVMYIKELDKQIMMSIFGSMGQREASGNELATSRILEKGWLRFIKGIRRQYELLLTSFYAEVLLPYNGIKNIDAIDIDVDWSELRFDSTADLMSAIREAAEAGIFLDKNEMRKAAQPAFPFLMPLEDKVNKKVEEIVKEQAQANSERRLVENYQRGKTKPS